MQHDRNHCLLTLTVITVDRKCMNIFLIHRYGSIYWLEMCDMENSHPWLYSQLEANPGSWTYQRHSESGFNGLAADQTIESTVNRESKTPGGVTGITMNRGEQ